MAYAPAADPQRLQQRGITRDEYEALIARDAFDEDARFELIDGVIHADMTPASIDHENVIQALTQLLVSEIKDLRVQLSVGCGPRSLPEPDLALAPLDPHARPEGARLAIEVVVTQWRQAQRKVPVYAAGGVGEYWIVHVPKRTVHVHRHAEGDAYTEVRALTGSDLLTVPDSDVAFTVDDVVAAAGG